MAEIKLNKRYKYAGDIVKALLNRLQWTLEDVTEFMNSIEDANVVEVKHGEWVEYPSDAYMKCSVCGMEYSKEKMPNIVGYCPNPNCGAKMDGGKKE